MTSNNKQQGFTLLEVLLAVSITALIGIGASQLLSRISNTSVMTEQRSNQLRNIQRMDLWLKRDLWQLTGRKTLDEFGNPKDALTSQGEFLVEFTHSGQGMIPFGDKKRSNLQRVAYAVRSHNSEYCEDAIKPINDEETGSCFIRLFWPVLDLAPDSKPPIVQVLLDEVESVEFQFRGQTLDLSNPNNSIRNNEWQDTWPSVYKTAEMVDDLVQIKMRYEIKMLGQLERIYEIPRHAYAQ